MAAHARAFRLLRKQALPERAEFQLDEFLAAEPAETRDLIASVGSALVDEGPCPGTL